MKTKLPLGLIPEKTFEGLEGIASETGKKAGEMPGEMVRDAINQGLGISVPHGETNVDPQTVQQSDEAKEVELGKKLHSLQVSQVLNPEVQTQNIQKGKEEERPSIPNSLSKTVQAPPGKKTGPDFNKRTVYSTHERDRKAA